jgi:hypothetical protein
MGDSQASIAQFVQHRLSHETWGMIQANLKITAQQSPCLLGDGAFHMRAEQ